MSEIGELRTVRVFFRLSGHRWWRLADSPIRIKAALILVPPALAAVLSAVFGLWSAGVQAQAADRSRALFDVSSAAAGLAQRLQAERVAAVTVLLPGSAATSESYEKAIGDTDEAVAELRDRRRDLGDVPGGVGSVLARVDADLRDVDGLRSRVRGGGQVALSAVAFGYRIAIADLIAYRQSVTQSGVDAVLADEMRAGTALSQAREAVGLQQVAVLQALALGRLTPTLNQEIVAARATGEQAMRDFAGLGRPAWRALAGRTLTGPQVLTAARLTGAVASTALSQPVELPGGAAGWSRAMTARADLLAVVESAVDADVRASLVRARDRRLRAAGWQGGAVLAVVVVALLFTAGVARSLVDRLRTLEAGALRVAHTELPELVGRLRSATDPVQAAALAEVSVGQVAVVVRGGDEVGKVAEAFNGVHAAAVRTAAAEARLRTQVVQMITSVARRVQVMTARVLTGLDGLERDEADPARLAQVFGVDHDATRLRRYAASLLVVAGGGPGQSQSEPVPIDQLVTGALSEVEGYQRIGLGRLVDVVVDPRAVDALVHILAELLDNATSFSAADRPVTVSAGWHGRDLLIRVADTGIGVAAADLERLNARLADAGLDVDVADRMGLIVVSRLAAQLGARVWLEPNPGGGVLAVVLVPADLITRVQRVYVRDLPPQAAIAAGPVTPELPLTGTGWQPAPTASYPGPTPTGMAAFQPYGAMADQQTRELPSVSPRDAITATTNAVAQPEPVIFQQVQQASPWLWQNGPTSEVVGGPRHPVEFDTAVDTAWRAARSAGEPTPAGTTARGLPIRRPGAHVVPDSGTPAGSGGAGPVVDPVAVRAQVAAAMRGLNAAAISRP